MGGWVWGFGVSCLGVWVGGCRVQALGSMPQEVVLALCACLTWRLCFSAFLWWGCWAQRCGWNPN